jgi:hypothetical protein
MFIKEVFSLGEIYQMTEGPVGVLDMDNCEITGKVMNKSKIILHLERLSDGRKANVFLRLKDDFLDRRDDFKKFLASKKIIGMSLNQLNNLEIAEL